MLTRYQVNHLVREASAIAIAALLQVGRNPSTGDKCKTTFGRADGACSFCGGSGPTVRLVSAATPLWAAMCRPCADACGDAELVRQRCANVLAEALAALPEYVTRRKAYVPVQGSVR